MIRRLRAGAPLAFIGLGFATVLGHYAGWAPRVLAASALAGWATAAVAAWRAKEQEQRSAELERLHRETLRAQRNGRELLGGMPLADRRSGVRVRLPGGEAVPGPSISERRGQPSAPFPTGSLTWGQE